MQLFCFSLIQKGLISSNELHQTAIAINDKWAHVTKNNKLTQPGIKNSPSNGHIVI